ARPRVEDREGGTDADSDMGIPRKPRSPTGSLLDAPPAVDDRAEYPRVLGGSVLVHAAEIGVVEPAPHNHRRQHRHLHLLVERSRIPLDELAQVLLLAKESDLVEGRPRDEHCPGVIAVHGFADVGRGRLGWRQLWTPELNHATEHDVEI